jgi:hypothetical protein
VELFFFGKKNQKTFVRLGGTLGGAVRRIADKSLFVSFSSEKEGSSLANLITGLSHCEVDPHHV